ncbi:endogenous retrovirus group V member 2 Env polyprotein-like [Strix aluco]|uniref:endogenous retrovirus group V member 2 Env polyprotein-like n=1 Tax=Strix aluco TaxID=111821 RepID=UPI003DA4C44C
MEGYTNLARKIVFFTIILVNVYAVVVAWNQNFFVGLLHGMAQGNNLSDCWVCTKLPKSGQFPFLGIPKFNIPRFTNMTGWVGGPTPHDLMGVWRPPNGNYDRYCLYELDLKIELEYQWILDQVDRNDALYNESKAIEQMWAKSTWPLRQPIMMRNRGSNSVRFLGTKKGAYQTCNNTYPRGSIRMTSYTGWGKFPGKCHDTAEWKHGPSEKRCSLPPGWWYLCANGKARKRLPQNWWGECTTGILLPISYPIRNLQGVSGTLWYQVKQKREVENPLVIRGTGFHSFVRWLIPMLGVSELEKAIVNISATVEILANATADAIVNLQKEINSLAEVTIQNRMALDLLMAKEGGVCTVINQSCCAFVNCEAQIETDVHRIWEASKLFHLIAQDDTSWGFTNLWEKLTSWLPNFAWLKQLFVLVVTLLILGLLTCILIKCFFGAARTLEMLMSHGKRISLGIGWNQTSTSKVLDQESVY